jgi:hypothetical protein
MLLNVRPLRNERRAARMERRMCDRARRHVPERRAGTRLVLAQCGQSGSGQVGDYRVTEGRYGIRLGEFLRLQCGTGRAIGVVPSRA